MFLAARLGLRPLCRFANQSALISLLSIKHSIRFALHRRGQ